MAQPKTQPSSKAAPKSDHQNGQNPRRNQTQRDARENSRIRNDTRKPVTAPMGRAGSSGRQGNPEARAKKAEPVRKNPPKATNGKNVALVKPLPKVNGKKKDSAVKRTLVPAHLVSAIILEELSIVANDVCNFTVEVELLRAGRLSEAYRAVVKKSEGLTVVSPYTAWVSAQAKAAVSKLSIDPQAALNAAIEDFRTCEEECKVTNLRVLEWSNSLARAEKVPYERELSRLRDYVGYIVGTSPDTDEIISRSKYGPGASVEVRGNATHYYAKLHSWDCQDRKSVV